MTIGKLKTFVVCLLLNICGMVVHAQFRQANIGINGLTCSQCSRSVEMQLRKLSFVKDVQMDLASTEGTITFAAGKKVDIHAVAKAVKDAGFSVRFLKANISQEDLAGSENDCIMLRGNAYKVIGTLPDKPLITLKFVGRDYLSKADLKQYKLPTAQCRAERVYYVAAD